MLIKDKSQKTCEAAIVHFIRDPIFPKLHCIYSDKEAGLTNAKMRKKIYDSFGISIRTLSAHTQAYQAELYIKVGDI